MRESTLGLTGWTLSYRSTLQDLARYPETIFKETFQFVKISKVAHKPCVCHTLEDVAKLSKLPEKLIMYLYWVVLSLFATC